MNFAKDSFSVSFSKYFSPPANTKNENWFLISVSQTFPFKFNGERTTDVYGNTEVGVVKVRVDADRVWKLAKKSVDPVIGLIFLGRIVTSSRWSKKYIEPLEVLNRPTKLRSLETISSSEIDVG